MLHHNYLFYVRGDAIALTNCFNSTMSGMILPLMFRSQNYFRVAQSAGQILFYSSGDITTTNGQIAGVLGFVKLCHAQGQVECLQHLHQAYTVDLVQLRQVGLTYVLQACNIQFVTVANHAYRGRDMYEFEEPPATDELRWYVAGRASN